MSKVKDEMKFIFQSKQNRPDGPGDSSRRMTLWQQTDPEGIRTPVAAVKGRCPGPLDDGAVDSGRLEIKPPRNERQSMPTRPSVVNWPDGLKNVIFVLAVRIQRADW